jgi:hypothetical protein
LNLLLECIADKLLEKRRFIAPRRQANPTQNPKSEYRNPKQTRRQIISKSENPKTLNPKQECFEFCVFQSFEFVSNFGFRASKFFLGALFDLAQDMLCVFARVIFFRFRNSKTTQFQICWLGLKGAVNFFRRYRQIE